MSCWAGLTQGVTGACCLVTDRSSTQLIRAPSNLAGSTWPIELASPPTSRIGNRSSESDQFGRDVLGKS
jgi:hypothetical protein